MSAQAVAEKILDSGWVEKRKVGYGLKPVNIDRYGDVLKMMQVPQIERMFKPETLNCEQVVNANTAQLYQADPNSEVLIIGDSFLRI